MFDRLPIELLLEIFSKLPPETNAKLSAVNKQVRKAAMSSQLWHMKFKRHFPHVYVALKQDKKSIDWLAEFRKTYDDEYKGLPVSVRKIFSCIKENDIESSRQIKIPSHKTLEHTDKHGTSLFMLATSIGNQDVLDCLYQIVLKFHTDSTRGELFIDTQKKDEYNRTILYWAIFYHQDDTIIQALLDNGSKLDELYHFTVNKSETGSVLPIHVAAQAGNLQAVKSFINQSPGLLEQGDSFDQTALIWAAALGHQEIVDYLIDNHANVNVTTNHPGKFDHGRTPLYWAAAHGHSEVVVKLIKAGAVTATAVGRNPSQPIHIAAKQGHLGVVKALIENDSKLIEQMDSLGQTPLLWAAANGHTAVVDYLISKGANINSATQRPGHPDHGRTPLYWAAVNGHSKVATSLVNANAITIDTKSKQMLIHNAAIEGKLDAVKTLIVIDPKLLDVKDKKNHTPLSQAARKGRDKVVSYLISKGAKVNLATSDPAYINDAVWTPLDWAVNHEQYEVVDIITLFNYCSGITHKKPALNTKNLKHIENFYNEFITEWKLEIKAMATSNISDDSKTSYLKALAKLDKKIQDEVRREQDTSIKVIKIMQHITLLMTLNKPSQQIGKGAVENEKFIREISKNDKLPNEWKRALIPMLHHIFIKNDVEVIPQAINTEYTKKTLDECISNIEAYLGKRKDKSGFFFNSKKDYDKRLSSWQYIQELMNGNQDKKVLMRTLNHDIARFSKGYFSNEYSKLLKELKKAISDYGQYERFTFTYKANSMP